MSHFLCKCGYDIRNISCPSTHEARVVTDMEHDDGELITLKDGCMRIYRDPLYSRDLIECPECWRIWIQTEPRGEYRSYSPDDEPIRLSERQGGYRG